MDEQRRRPPEELLTEDRQHLWDHRCSLDIQIRECWQTKGLVSTVWKVRRPANSSPLPNGVKEPLLLFLNLTVITFANQRIPREGECLTQAAAFPSPTPSGEGSFGLTLGSLPRFPPTAPDSLSASDAAHVYAVKFVSVEKGLAALFRRHYLSLDKKELCAKPDFAPLQAFPPSFESIQCLGVKAPGAPERAFCTAVFTLNYRDPNPTQSSKGKAGEIQSAITPLMPNPLRALCPSQANPL